MKRGWSFYLVLFCFVLPGLTLRAQNQGVDGLANIQAISSGNGMFRSFDNRYKGLDGSPLLFTEFVPGKIWMTSDQPIVCDKLNFDAVLQELIVLKNGKELGVNQSMIKSFVFYTLTDTLLFKKIYNQDGKWVYMEELVAGPVTLLKEHLKVINGPTHTGAYSTGKTSSEIEKTERYFFTTNGVTLLTIKNKKSLQPHFSRHENTIDSLVKVRKINFKNETDLHELFHFLNGLQK